MASPRHTQPAHLPPPRSVLVVVTRQIGDVLLTTPLIARAHALWPGVTVDVLGIEGTLGMLDGQPLVRQCITVPARLGAADLPGVARRLWRRHDLALVADPGDRAHLLAWMAAPLRSGVLPAGHRSNRWKRSLLAHVVESPGDRGAVHVVQERIALLAPWDAATTTTSSPTATAAPIQPPPRVLPPPAEPLPDLLRSRLQPRPVVLHTPSMWRYKQWPLTHYRDLAQQLCAAGHQVVLSRGPGAHDLRCVQAVLGAAPEPQLIDAGVLRFGQLTSLLRDAALYIGPDTSITHMAAACGVPVIALFGPTAPQRWGPWPGADAPDSPESPDRARPVRFVQRAARQDIGNVTLLQADLPCVPCGRAGCDDHRDSRADCLPAITAQRVAAVALELLAR